MASRGHSRIPCYGTSKKTWQENHPTCFCCLFPGKNVNLEFVFSLLESWFLLVCLQSFTTATGDLVCKAVPVLQETSVRTEDMRKILWRYLFPEHLILVPVVGSYLKGKQKGNLSKGKRMEICRLLMASRSGRWSDLTGAATRRSFRSCRSLNVNPLVHVAWMLRTLTFCQLVGFPIKPRTVIHF